jgi:hypothetical protein
MSLCQSFEYPGTAKDQEQTGGSEDEDEEGYEEEEDETFEDLDTNLEVEADDPESIRIAEVEEFVAGDVVGKLMALVSQLRANGDQPRLYLRELCLKYNCRPLEIKLWVRTRWGSLSDCFERVLELKKVSQV